MNKLLIITLLLILGCNKQSDTETLTGDLYFSFFRIGNYYNQPDSVIRQYESYFDTVTLENLSESDKRLIRHYKLLKEKELLYQPFIYLKTNQDSVVSLYLDSIDYNRIKIHKRKELQDERKKLKIQAIVTMIDSGLYKCEKLQEVEIVDGETFQKQKKFKIEDYN